MGSYYILARIHEKFGLGFDDASARCLVDPEAELTDGCSVVVQIKGAVPFVTRWFRTGRDGRGRFIRAGDPNECFYLGFGLSYTKARRPVGEGFRTCGRNHALSFAAQP